MTQKEFPPETEVLKILEDFYKNIISFKLAEQKYGIPKSTLACQMHNFNPNNGQLVSNRNTFLQNFDF